MNPSPDIVLMSPGKEEIHGGPDKVWIDNLRSNLELVLRKDFGSPVQSITPDNKDAAEAFANAVVLIALLHESYPASGKYLSFLKENAGKEKARTLIRLDASPGKWENIPEPFRRSASVEMVQVTDGESQWIGEESGIYWAKLLDLAAEVKAMEETGKGASPAEKTVYLAESSGDMMQNRDILRRELVEYGYKVIPATDLNVSGKELKSSIQSLVDRSHLAIHMLGNAYGEVLKDSGVSMAEMQLQYVSEYLDAIGNDPVHAEKELSRLIWIDPEFNPVDTSQEELVNRLRSNIENLSRTEIIQTPLELFKTLVIRRLQKSSSRISGIGTKEAQPGFLYLVHAPDDQKEARELAGGLQKKGLQTLMLNYDGGNLLDDHRKFLRECDGALIYYGRSNRPWLRSKVLDLLKAPGMGRMHAFRIRQVLAGKEDQLEDYSPPPGIPVIRERDLSKAIDIIVKNLNR